MVKVKFHVRKVKTCGSFLFQPFLKNGLLLANPSSAQIHLYVFYILTNTRMSHQEPDNKIMVQSNRVYIHKQ